MVVDRRHIVKQSEVVPGEGQLVSTREEFKSLSAAHGLKAAAAEA
jgi:hypothetical protein